MSDVPLLYKITLQLHDLLKESGVSVEERETTIRKMDDLLYKREILLKDIQGPYDEEEVKIGKLILDLDEVIKEKMAFIFRHIQTDMKKVKEKKVLNRSYINPYGNIKTTDGMYLDSKQ